MTKVNNKRNIIEKSNKLIFAENIIYSKRELILMDFYLSKINPRDLKTKVVTVKKSDIENLLGVQIKPEELHTNIINLMKTSISIQNEIGEWVEAVILQESRCYKGEDNQWYLTLKCSDFAQKYMFDVAKIGYTRYQIQDILNLKLTKSILLFPFLLASKRNNPTFQISLNKLKKHLGCTETYFDSFKVFNSKILKPCINDINEHNSLYNVSYKKISDSNKFVKAIEFTVVSTNKEILLGSKKNSYYYAINSMKQDLLQ